MGLIDGKQGDADVLQQGAEALIGDAFGGDEEHAETAGAEVGGDSGGLRGGACRV